jgi:hypothetical protein
MKIIENDQLKALSSPSYNFFFRKTDGFFVRWGATKEDDPDFSPFGCEILDLELSEGRCDGSCQICYKGNGHDQPEYHMTLDQFKLILDKMPKTLTQIAFGLTNTTSNPDIWGILSEARNREIVPNLTSHGLDITPEVAEKLAAVCGAVAISVVNKEKSYNAIDLLTKAKEKPGSTLKQVNIHFVYHSANEDAVYNVFKDIKTDPRLKKLNAIVLLGLKQKGKAETGFESLGYERFAKIIEYAMANQIPIGFDSCSQCKYERWVKSSNLSDEDKKRMLIVAEPCESNLFSFYINCHGIAYPCSFMEGTEGWEEGISVFDHQDFVNDVWNHEKFQEWRKKLLGNNRNCPVYKV